MSFSVSSLLNIVTEKIIIRVIEIINKMYAVEVVRAILDISCNIFSSLLTLLVIMLVLLSESEIKSQINKFLLILEIVSFFKIERVNIITEVIAKTNLRDIADLI